MVATRRGLRVGSPNAAEADETQKNMEATPGTGRSKRTAVQRGGSSQSEVLGGSQDDEVDAPTPSGVLSSAMRRRARVARHLDQNAPQLDSTHEADVSESESCCSVTSDRQNTPEGRMTRSRRRRAAPRQTPSSSRAADEASEADSICSSASATQEPKTQRVTRSQRKKVLCAKLQTEDTEQSEPDSCSSNVSGLHSTVVRQTTRSRKSRGTTPIPMCLGNDPDDGATSSMRVTRTRRAKQASASETLAFDLEGFESGPSWTPRRSNRKCVSARSKGHVSALSDSGSESTDACSSLSSPRSLRARDAPRGSCTRSGHSIPAVLVPQITIEAPGPLVQLEIPAESRIKLKDDQEQTLEGRTSSQTVPEDVSEDKMMVEHEDAVEDVENVSLRLDSSMIETSEQETTLTAEDVDGFSSEKTVEPQIIQESALSKSDKITLSESANEDEDSKEKDGPSETADVPGSSLIKMNQVEVGSIERAEGAKEAHVDDSSSVTPSPSSSSQSAKVILSESDHMVEKELEEGRGTVEPLTAPVCQTDKTIVEHADDGACTTITEEASHHRGPGVVQKCSWILLDSSEDEDDSEDGHTAEESESENDTLGIDRKTQDPSLDENQPGPSKHHAAVPSNGLFVIDTQPGLRLDENYYLDEGQKGVNREVGEAGSGMEEDKSEEEFVDEEDDEDAEVLFMSRNKALVELSSTIDPGLKVKEIGGLYINFDGKKSQGVSSNLKKLKEQKNQDELLKKSVIGPDFEKMDTVAPYKESLKKQKMKRREEKERTTGDGWFNMRQPELTEELKNDLRVLKMRSVMDPKRFYKKNDREGFPKYFQVGTVVDSPVDFYHARIPRKERKRTIVEELLSDAEFRSHNKKKYREILSEKAAMASRKKHRRGNKVNKKAFGQI